MARRKGGRAERETVNMFRKAGYVAERTSPVQASGSTSLPDVSVSVNPDWTMRVECKADGAVPKYVFKKMANPSIEVLMLKRSNQGWLCVIRPELLFRLLEKVQNGSEADTVRNHDP